MKYIATLFSVSLICGCSTQGYPGGARPQSETAKIYFKGNGRVSLKDRIIDGVEQNVSNNSIVVLPGTNSGSVKYQLAMKECPMYSVGCINENIFGQCDLTIHTEAGKEYVVDLNGKDKEVLLSITEEESGKTAGEGMCTHKDKGVSIDVMHKRSTIENF